MDRARQCLDSYSLEIEHMKLMVANAEPGFTLRLLKVVMTMRNQEDLATKGF